jgi:bacterioferritin (cytochrome b1)
LGRASIGHADAVASAIRLLGGTPKWAFDSPPEGDDIVKTFKAQLEKEKTAAELHRKVAAMFTDPSMKASFLQFSKDETHHEELVEKILQKINQ